MPRVQTESQSVRDARERQAALDYFANSPAWRRSAKGNLWRRWEGKSVTVFRRADGSYGWCFAGCRFNRYSEYPYETEEEAIEFLARAVEAVP